MAVVVKRLTQRIVAPSCARSNRVSRPICKHKGLTFRISLLKSGFAPEQGIFLSTPLFPERILVFPERILEDTSDSVRVGLPESVRKKK